MFLCTSPYTCPAQYGRRQAKMVNASPVHDENRYYYTFQRVVLLMYIYWNITFLLEYYWRPNVAFVWILTARMVEVQWHFSPMCSSWWCLFHVCVFGAGEQDHKSGVNHSTFRLEVRADSFRALYCLLPQLFRAESCPLLLMERKLERRRPLEPRPFSPATRATFWWAPPYGNVWRRVFGVGRKRIVWVTQQTSSLSEHQPC